MTAHSFTEPFLWQHSASHSSFLDCTQLYLTLNLRSLSMTELISWQQSVWLNPFLDSSQCDLTLSLTTLRFDTSFSLIAFSLTESFLQKLRALTLHFPSQHPASHIDFLNSLPWQLSAMSEISLHCTELELTYFLSFTLMSRESTLRMVNTF